MKNPVLIAIVLFIVACCLPALYFTGRGQPDDTMFGLRALAVGWSGIFGGVPAWYANPFFALGVVLAFLRKSLFSAIAGIVAIAIACTIYSDIGRELPGDEGNVTHTTITRLLPGFYVWVASMAALPLVALQRKSK